MSFKSPCLDKWDAHFPNKTHWVQDEYYTSKQSENFHLSTGWVYNNASRATKFGIHKKAYHATHKGLFVDNRHVGKSDGL